MKVATVFRFGLVTALLLAATGICLAVPNTFIQGEALSSSKMNQNFADLDTKLAASRVATIGTVSYSVGATKQCGATDPVDGKVLAPGAVGYAAAKILCEGKCSSKTAHMCSSEEAVRLAQMGQGAGLANGWISTGAAATSPGPGAVVNDCYGWTTNIPVASVPAATQQFGTLWTGFFPGFVTCDKIYAINCCD